MSFSLQIGQGSADLLLNSPLSIHLIKFFICDVVIGRERSVSSFVSSNTQLCLEPCSRNLPTEQRQNSSLLGIELGLLSAHILFVVINIFQLFIVIGQIWSLGASISGARQHTLLKRRLVGVEPDSAKGGTCGALCGADASVAVGGWEGSRETGGSVRCT